MEMAPGPVGPSQGSVTLAQAEPEATGGWVSGSGTRFFPVEPERENQRLGQAFPGPRTVGITTLTLSLF